MLIDDDWEGRALRARFRALAGDWELGFEEAGRLLAVEASQAHALLVDGAAIPLDRDQEARMRLAIEVDRALGRAIRPGFAGLVWLRLDGKPSRLDRMSHSLADMREVRREAEAA